MATRHSADMPRKVLSDPLRTTRRSRLRTRRSLSNYGIARAPSRSHRKYRSDSIFCGAEDFLLGSAGIPALITRVSPRHRLFPTGFRERLKAFTGDSSEVFAAGAFQVMGSIGDRFHGGGDFHGDGSQVVGFHGDGFHGGGFHGGGFHGGGHH